MEAAAERTCGGRGIEGKHDIVRQIPAGWLYRPGRWLTAYLMCTVVAYIASPFQIHGEHWLWAVLYGAVVWLSFYLGQRAGVSVDLWSPACQNVLVRHVNGRVLLLSAYTCAVIGVVLVSLGYAPVFSSVLSGAMSPGQSYFEKFSITVEWSGRVNAPMQVYTVTNALILLLVPTAAWYWAVLKWPARVACFGAVAVRVVPSILNGTLVDLGLVGTEVVVSIVASVASGRTPRLSGLRMAALSAILVAVILFVAVGVQLSRADALGWSPWLGGELRYYNPHNVLTDILGARLAFGVHLMISYVTQGYEGLGQCLQLPFVWTFGVGHSRALMEYADQYLGWDWIWERHYLWRNFYVNGRHPLVYWSTALTWIASDVTFWGVPLVVFLIGLAFGKSWRRVVQNGDPLMLALFIRIVLLVVFLPGNLQVLQGRVMWWGTMGLLALAFARWIRRHISASPVTVRSVR